MESKKILIGGNFVTAKDDFKVFAPFSGDHIAAVGQADEKQFSVAVDAAVSAAKEMKLLPRYKLREGLQRISEGIRERREEFSHMIAMEAGKPIRIARLETERAISTFRIAAAEAERFDGEIVPVDVVPGAENRRGITSFEPRGVIVGITPFNFPLNLVAHKAAPALASGNAVIIKPSEKTPLSSLLLGEVFLASGLPAGAFQVVPAEIEVLRRILGDERINMISFTGSDRVGWDLKSTYPRKVLALEMGGNAPVIVDETADTRDAAKRICGGAFSYSGQTCISVQRILASSEIGEELISEISSQANKLRFGDPLLETTDISCMISKEAAEKTFRTINEAVDAGSHLICGGKLEGSYVEPTIVGNVSAEMAVVKEEVFAPVATFEPYTEFEEAIRSANSGKFGLQAGVFTNDLSRARFAVRQLEFGGVIINDVPGFRVDSMPYGGIKDSGLGLEGVRYAMRDMSISKLAVYRS